MQEHSPELHKFLLIAYEENPAIFSKAVEQTTTGDGVVETDVCEQHTLEKLYIESVRRSS